jgi:hypothetical protein
VCSHAAVLLGSAFTYQGQLQDNGTPANGNYDLQFRLYDAASAGFAVTAPLPVVNVVAVNGLISVPVDFGVGPFNGNAVWLEIGVRPGGTSGAYTILIPRQALTAAPYALMSEQSLSVAPAGVTASMLGANSVGAAAINAAQVQRRVTGACSAGQSVNTVNQDGTVSCSAGGSGTITGVTAGTGLTGGGTSGTVTVNASLAGSGAATTLARSDHDHYGQGWSGDSVQAGLQVTNVHTGTTAIIGISSATIGASWGVEGISNSGDVGAYGVIGKNLATSGSGDGVLGVNFAPAGAGVVGRAQATTGAAAGVSGTSSSASGFAVLAENAAITGTAVGVHAESASPQGTAIEGRATATSGSAWGVDGQTASATGYGVYAANNAGGTALKVNGLADIGSVLIAQNAGTGKVLTSDATGHASWAAAQGAVCAVACSGAVSTVSTVNTGGSCAVTYNYPCAPFACNGSGAGATCRNSCVSSADCSSGSACDTATGQCTFAGNQCKDSFTIRAPDETETSCAPYRCQAGACKEHCFDNTECAPGYTCNTTAQLCHL